MPCSHGSSKGGRIGEPGVCTTPEYAGGVRSGSSGPTMAGAAGIAIGGSAISAVMRNGPTMITSPLTSAWEWPRPSGCTSAFRNTPFVLVSVSRNPPSDRSMRQCCLDIVRSGSARAQLFSGPRPIVRVPCSRVRTSSGLPALAAR